MEEKLQFVPSLKDAFAIGMKNLVPIVLSVLLWLVTVALARHRMDSLR